MSNPFDPKELIVQGYAGPDGRLVFRQSESFYDAGDLKRFSSLQVENKNLREENEVLRRTSNKILAQHFQEILRYVRQCEKYQKKIEKMRAVIQKRKIPFAEENFVSISYEKDVRL